MIRQLFSCLGWVTSEAVPMSEQGLVDWEAENETHVGLESRRVIEDIFGDGDVVYQDRYFGPRNSDRRLAGSSPQDAGAETPVEVAVPPAASTGPPSNLCAEVCRAHRNEYCPTCDLNDDDLWVHPRDLEDSPAPDGSQQLGDEIRGAEGAAETLSGGGTNRPTSELLNEAADLIEIDVDADWAQGKRRVLGREFVAELRARAARIQGFEDTPRSAAPAWVKLALAEEALDKAHRQK